MSKFIIIIISFFVAGCNAKETLKDLSNPEFEIITFDVVEKQILIETTLPTYVESLITKWFNQKVKINGFEGDMKFIISDFLQEISPISDGKRVDISISFDVILYKPSKNQTNSISGKVSSYGTITGNFSLKEFDVVIQKAQSDLILRLSRDLQSKN